MTGSQSPREFRIFEVDKYGNRWFVCSRPSVDLAKSYLSRVLSDGAEYVIEDENGVRH